MHQSPARAFASARAASNAGPATSIGERRGVRSTLAASARTADLAHGSRSFGMGSPTRETTAAAIIEIGRIWSTCPRLIAFIGIAGYGSTRPSGRPEERIDRGPVAVDTRSGRHADDTVEYENVTSRRRNVNGSNVDGHSVFGVNHAERRHTRQDRGQHAPPRRRDMHDDDHGASIAGWSAETRVRSGSSPPAKAPTTTSSRKPAHPPLP